MISIGVIMAGGGGTRFWPLSRKETPKQLLNLSGKDVMVNETINRLARVTDKENIYIVTNVTQVDKMESVTKGRIPACNILSEPAARNTAACIGYAAVKVVAEHGDGVMVITPSDAFIKDEATYATVLKTAISEADKTNRLITVGIKPTFPATGYGYIRYTKSEAAAKSVVQFVEKPDLVKAEEYLKSGDYLWNSGIFVWKVSVILDKFKTLLPDIYDKLITMSKSFGAENEEDIINAVYPTIRSISVDYGIMEKTNDILVVPGDFGWNDVGSWDMMGVLHDADENNNVKVGNTLVIDSKDSVIYSSGKLVSVVGIDNLVVVETPDAVLVCPKDKAQDVKKIVDELKRDGRQDLL